MVLKKAVSITNNEHPGLKQLDDRLKEFMAKGFPLQKIADNILEVGQNLDNKKIIKKDLLHISLHKIRSTEWNCLLVKYREMPWLFHIEILTIPPQTSLEL